MLRTAASSPVGDPRRRDVFRGDTEIPAVGFYVRKVGRPRQDWTSQLLKVAAERLGQDQFRNLLFDTSEDAEKRWYAALSRGFLS